MATRKLVPDADNEGGIGTALKKWASGFIKLLTFDRLILTTGLADQEYCGITEEGTGGATAIAFGTLCYLKASDSLWYPAQADVTATSGIVKLGMCVLAGTSAATRMLKYGNIRANSLFPSFSPLSGHVYASAAAAGEVTSTAPAGTTGFVVRVIGRANTADELFFNPSNDYTELA
jgi:hypothetical protein